MKKQLAWLLLPAFMSFADAAPALAMTAQEYQQSLDEMAAPNYRPPQPPALQVAPRPAPPAQAAPPPMDSMQQRMIAQRDALMRQQNAKSEEHSDAEYPYLQSAEQGNMQAIAQLGFMNLQGAGKPKDIDRAIFWYSRGAEKHDYASTAQLVTIGNMFEFGDKDAPVDYDKAMRLYMQAYEGGNKRAADCISRMYEKGLGVPKDAANAAYWHTLSLDVKPQSLRPGKMRPYTGKIPL